MAVQARPKYVGGAVKRREDPRLLSGRGRYVADIQLPRMLHLAIVRSPMAHATISKIDPTEALAEPGTVAVVTFSEIREDVQPLPSIDLFPDSKPALHTALADGKVRYVGEPVAAVLATDPYAAEDAAELVGLDLEPLPVVLSIDDATTAGAPVLYEEFGTNVANTIRQETGDVAAAFSAAAHVFEETFTIHRYGPVPMETRGVVAEFNATTGRLKVYSSTQFPHLLRAFISGTLSLPESKVQVIAPDVGGGFGAKCEFYPEEVLVPLLAMRTGRPVRWVEDRREHLISTTQAREQKHKIKAAVDADGTITAVDVESWTNNGSCMFTLATTPASIFSAMLRGPYRIPNYRSVSHSVLSNKTPLAVYRGAGHPQAAFVMERTVDIIAGRLGLDRAELRRHNMLTSDELPSDRGTEIVLAGKVNYDSGDYPRCLSMALDLIGYDAFPARQREALQAGRYLGLGLCCFVEETAIGPFESAVVRVDGQGKVTVLTGCSPHGQGHVTALSQLVADEFEIPLEDITVLYGDTDLIPDGFGTFASRSAAIGGAAARKAAAKVKARAMRVASHVLEVDPADLEWADGEARVKGDPSASVSLAAAAQAATAMSAPLSEDFGFHLTGEDRFQPAGIAFSNAVHAVITEVDIRTGQVDIQKYVVVHDCGTVVNPIIVEGQVHGGVAQGIGGTLLEEFPYAPDGQPLATTFMDYLLPTVDDIPDIVIDHLETPTPLNPYGIKGAGEGGAVGAPGCIVNAIADALGPLGVHLTDDGPYSPAKVLGLVRRTQPGG
jgi:aerobic carbon-monoxide dehydrogenase large subunit